MQTYPPRHASGVVNLRLAPLKAAILSGQLIGLFAALAPTIPPLPANIFFSNPLSVVHLIMAVLLPSTFHRKTASF